MTSWTGFLATAGRLYKYPFEEQLMIHAQRPDAVACAPLETWNKPMHRYVRRGSKGIALLDNTGGKPRLKYVFDVADTVDGRYNARKPYVWEIRSEHAAPVVDALRERFDDALSLSDDADAFSGHIENTLGGAIFGLARTLAARYYEDNRSDIGYSTEGSFLEDYDEFNVSVAFKDALTVSTAYALQHFDK
jgi:hypothetical protein